MAIESLNLAGPVHLVRNEHEEGPQFKKKKFFFTLFTHACFLGSHPRHMEVPRLRVKLEL